MPKIVPWLLESVFYLYENRKDAEIGKPFGGTGFLVGVSTEIPNWGFIYAVTNWHVAVRGGASVIRLNKRDGGVDIIDYSPDQWIFKPGGYDIAIAPLPLIQDIHSAAVMSEQMLMSEELMRELEIGPGEDVFMIGRFVDHDGAGTNIPATRFGHISVMPQPIRQPTGSMEPSFILDVHSRTGFSGSPVFVYRTIASDLTKLDIEAKRNWFVRLLAVHWDQFPERWEIEQGHPKTEEGISLSDNAQYIKGLSGMTLAAPAWAIRELLDTPKLKHERFVATEQEKLRRAADGEWSLSGETAADPANPHHKEDFMRLLGAAAKAKPRAGQT